MIAPWALEVAERLLEFRSVWKGSHQSPPWPCKHGNPLQSFLKDGDTRFCFPRWAPGRNEWAGGYTGAVGAVGQHRGPWGGSRVWQPREALEHSSGLGAVINQELRLTINSLSDNEE